MTKKGEVSERNQPRYDQALRLASGSMQSVLSKPCQTKIGQMTKNITAIAEPGQQPNFTNYKARKPDQSTLLKMIKIRTIFSD